MASVVQMICLPFSAGNTGEQIREHKLATSIINLHGTEDCVFDDNELDLLKRFVVGRSDARREAVLRAEEWHDGPSSNKDRSLAGYLISGYGTDNPALDERDWELLEQWIVKGMPTGEHVRR